MKTRNCSADAPKMVTWNEHAVRTFRRVFRGAKFVPKRVAQHRFLAMSFCSFAGAEIFKDHFDAGIYVCVKCGYELFSSKVKYQHSSPWPAFTDTIHPDSVVKEEERRGALKIRCGKCNHGLGHEFLNDGPKRGLSRF